MPEEEEEEEEGFLGRGDPVEAGPGRWGPEATDGDCLGEEETGGRIWGSPETDEEQIQA